MPEGNGINKYPTEEELKRVEKFNKFDMNEVKDFLSFLKSIWWMPDWGFEISGKKVLKLELHTGGWSGNEDIIQALEKTMFWTLWWEKTVRGGHYYFKISEVAADKEKG